MKYANNTEVNAGQSRAEIERTLVRYGASQFAYGWSDGSAVVAFTVNGIGVKLTIPMPKRESPEFTEDKRGKRRQDSAIDKSWEQATRQRWRAMALVIKAKLEAVECGISTFEDEFLSGLLLANGKTVGEWAKPQLLNAIGTGSKPKALLPGVTD